MEIDILHESYTVILPGADPGFLKGMVQIVQLELVFHI